jgi:pimeloyl-ACP methyl ester carboxylesterase
MKADRPASDATRPGRFHPTGAGISRRDTLTLAAAGLAAPLLPTTSLAQSRKETNAMAANKPTIVLVHGAFADASSWNAVIATLKKDGYPVVAVANPLRSVSGDAGYVRNLLATIKTPVVLVGHSYGGMVISEAANGQDNVTALVYVAAFAPEPQESAGGLNSKFPGSLLGPDTLAEPVSLSGGGHDLYVRADKFHQAFAPDLPEAAASLAAATQRPITDIAFGEPATASAWKSKPSWFVYGDHDTAIPPKLHTFMAERARSRETVVVKGASHVLMISHPQEVTRVIEDAATAH